MIEQQLRLQAGTQMPQFYALTVLEQGMWYRKLFSNVCNRSYFITKIKRKTKLLAVILWKQESWLSGETKAA